MNQPRLSLTDQQTLEYFRDSFWIDVDRTGPREFSRLQQLGLVRYHSPMHAYVVTKKGVEWLRQKSTEPMIHA